MFTFSFIHLKVEATEPWSQLGLGSELSADQNSDVVFSIQHWCTVSTCPDSSIFLQHYPQKRRWFGGQ